MVRRLGRPGRLAHGPSRTGPWVPPRAGRWARAGRLLASRSGGPAAACQTPPRPSRTSREVPVPAPRAPAKPARRSRRNVPAAREVSACARFAWGSAAQKARAALHGETGSLEPSAGLRPPFPGSTAAALRSAAGRATLRGPPASPSGDLLTLVRGLLPRRPRPHGACKAKPTKARRGGAHAHDRRLPTLSSAAVPRPPTGRRRRQAHAKFKTPRRRWPPWSL